MKHTSNIYKPSSLFITGLIMSFIAFLPLLGSRGEPSFITLVCGSLMLLGLFFMGWGIVLFFTNRVVVGQPDIQLSKDILQVGETFTLDFQHTFRNNVIVDSISILFLYRETASYGSGTDRETVIHERVHQNFSMTGGDFRRGHTVSKHFNWQIPSDTMHTLKVKDNFIQWFIYVEIVIPRLPDFIEEREIIVVPKMTTG